MAVVDPYSPCPCGSGEKFKWCCHKVEGYAERAQRLADNGQIDAALGALDEGLRKAPDNPWLSVRKALILARRDEAEPAKEILRRVIQRRPTHVGAQGLLIRLVIQTEGPAVGAGQLQQALAAVKPEHRAGLAILAELIGAMMVEEGKIPAAVAHLELARGLNPDDEASEADSSLRMVEANNSFSSWLRNPYRLSPVPEGVDEEKRRRFAEALEWADQGLWSPAAAAFDALSAEGTPESDRNLGLCRLWLGDERGAVEALRRYTHWTGATPDNVDLEALCQVIAPPGEDERVMLLQWIWPVRDREALLRALRADDRVHDDGHEEAEADDPDSFEADHFLLLDRPQPAPSAVSGPGDVARVQGRLLVGQEIVALEAFDDGRLDPLAARFRELAGEAIPPAHPRTKFVGRSTRSALALQSEWILPEGIEPPEAQRLNREERRRIVMELWPQTPMPYLGGRTPRQAGLDGDAQLPLRAAICQFELGIDFFDQGLDLGVLRRELKVDPEPEIDPETVEVDRVHLARLHRLPAGRLDDKRLVDLFAIAHRYLMPKAIENAARALIERPAILDGEQGPPRFVVYSDLANLAMSRGERAEAFDWLARGRSGEPGPLRAPNAPRWDMLEVRLHARVDPPEQWVPMLSAAMDRHQDTAAGTVILSNLMDMGLVRLVAHPDRPGEVIPDTRMLQGLLARYGPRITTASGQLGVTAARGGIWTPGSEAGGPAGVWTPGASSAPEAGVDKPKLIIPGR